MMDGSMYRVIYSFERQVQTILLFYFWPWTVRQHPHSNFITYSTQKASPMYIKEKTRLEKIQYKKTLRQSPDSRKQAILMLGFNPMLQQRYVMYKFAIPLWTYSQIFQQAVIKTSIKNACPKLVFACSITPAANHDAGSSQFAGNSEFLCFTCTQKINEGPHHYSSSFLGNIMLDGSCTNFERLHCIEVHQEAIVSKSID
jgi:hypothetical protein